MFSTDAGAASLDRRPGLGSAGRRMVESAAGHRSVIGPYRTALITGASSGLGAAFAAELARRGTDLVLVARSDQALRELQQRLRKAHGVRVTTIARDLTVPGAVDHVIARLRAGGTRVDLLVNNAGFATQGRLETIPAGRDHDQVLLNVLAVVDLTHALLPDLLAARTAGISNAAGIINVASLGGFQPAPYLAVYAASKAFVLSFSQALSAELRGRGVHVLALCPGPVDTPFFDVLGSDTAGVGQRLAPSRVITAALDALERRQSVVVPGWRNNATAVISRLAPRSLVLNLAERTTRRVLADVARGIGGGGVTTAVPGRMA